jgi:hypothetical protein
MWICNYPADKKAVDKVFGQVKYFGLDQVHRFLNSFHPQTKDLVVVY